MKEFHSKVISFLKSFKKLKKMSEMQGMDSLYFQISDLTFVVSEFKILFFQCTVTVKVAALALVTVG